MASWRLSLTAALALMFLLTGYAFDLELTPKKVLSRIGEKVVLSCRAKDCLSPSIKWKVRTDRLLTGTVREQGSESTLTFDKVTLQNAQVYTCIAKCQGEPKKKQRDVMLRVYSLPDTVTLETVGSLQVGRKGTVRCTIPDVYPAKFEVQWLNETGVMKTENVNRHNGKMKNVTVTYELTPELQHSGQKLTCRVNLGTEKELQVEGTLTLDIHYPPRMINISAKPSLTVREGQNVSLTCTADGNSPVSIVWSKLSAKGWSVIAQNQSTYHLSPTRIENSGTYRCEAKNELGKNTTEVEFRVEGGPRDTRLTVTPSSVKQGDNVTINCTTHSNPPARLVLRRNLTSGQTELKSENGIFSIRAVQLEDGGWYRCEAKNDLGRQTIETELIVQYPPRMINISAKPSLTVREGQNVSLTCTADGSSPVSIVWSKLSAKGWSVIAQNQSTYHLSPTRIDSGTYRCEAKNELGKNTTEVEFRVEGSPRDTRLSVTSSAVKEGDSVTISSRTHSNPEGSNDLGMQTIVTEHNVQVSPRDTRLSVTPSAVKEGDSVTISSRTHSNSEGSNDLGMQTTDTEHNVQAQGVVTKVENPVGVVASAYTGAAVGSVGLVISGVYYIYRRTNLKNSYQMSNDIL